MGFLGFKSWTGGQFSVNLIRPAGTVRFLKLKNKRTRVLSYHDSKISSERNPNKITLLVQRNLIVRGNVNYTTKKKKKITFYSLKLTP